MKNRSLSLIVLCVGALFLNSACQAGPLLGFAGYCATKTIGYGAAAVGLVTVAPTVVATGPLVTVGALFGFGGAAAAAGVLTSTAVAIESASVTVGAFLTALPTI